MKNFKNYFLTTIAILCIVTLTKAQSLPSYVPTNGLIGYWPFSGNANDESGNGNIGTVSGATLTSDRNGNINSAYSFDGVTNWIEVTSLNNISYSPITYSAWVLADSLVTIIYPLGGGNVIVGRDRAGYNDQGSLMIYHYPATGINNSFFYYIGQGGSNSNYTPQLSSWVHVVFSIENNDSAKFVVNGNLINTSYFPTNGNANIPFKIGSGTDVNISLGRQFWNGKIDDVGVWNRALTQQEVTALYNSSTCSVPSYIPSNGLMGYWPFCGNANDESGNGNIGVVTGASLTSDINGVSNSAYYFDGISNYIKVNTIFDYEYSTTSLWFNSSNIIGNNLNSKQILNIDAPSLIYGRANIEIEDSVLLIAAGGDTNGITQPINAFQWYHLAGVRDGAICYYYLNGNLIGSNSSGTVTNTANPNPNLVIGVDRSEVVQFYEGKIDDIGIWNRALTQQEILNIYTGTTSGIVNLENNYSIKIFPNPAFDHFTVQFQDLRGEMPKAVELNDASGRLIERRISNGADELIFSIKNLSSGSYSVRVVFESGDVMDRQVNIVR